jgi:YQGE family putative transporter
MIAWFTLVSYVITALTFWLAGKWVKQHNKMNCLRSGVACSATFYVSMLWLGDRSADYWFGLGSLQGVSSGLFWLAFHVLYFEVTDRENRDQFNRYSGLLTSLSSMIAPWISSLLITKLDDQTGYRCIFFISLCTFLVGVAISFFLKKRPCHGQYDWLFVWKSMTTSHTTWRPICAAIVAQGLREGVFSFSIGLLVYMYAARESSVGNYMLVTALLSFFSFWAIGKWLTPAQRDTSMLIGVTLLTASLIPLLWQRNEVAIWIFGIGTAISYPLYSMPMLASVFDWIGQRPTSVEQREEYVVMREIALNAGRVTGIVLLLLVLAWTDARTIPSAVLVILGCAPWLSWLFLRTSWHISRETLDKVSNHRY